MRKSLLILLAIFSFTACSNQQEFGAFKDSESKPNFATEVIYGEDNRKDWFEVLDPNVLEAARATVGIVDQSAVYYDGELSHINTDDLPLCPDQKFSGQRKAPICSGFLVGPDLVLTAGHCIESESQCRDFKFIFDFAKESREHEPTVLDRSSVYSCRELVGREFTNSAQDWALVRLDRPVLDRSPLEIERSSQPKVGTPLTLIGHPSGLPSKISRGGLIHKIEDHHYVADLDSFGGNSGSAVLNTQTLKVEGILVRGRTDYKMVNGCLKVNVCEEGIGTECKYPGAPIEGEHISKIIELADLIPPLSQNSTRPAPPVDEVKPRKFLSQVMLPIPDFYFQKVFSKITDLPALQGSDLKVRLVIEHTYISDLKVTLVAPSGARLVLHGNTGPRVENIIGTYGEELTPKEPFSSLGSQSAGDWFLEIQDSAPYDKGYLIEWEIVTDNTKIIL